MRDVARRSPCDVFLEYPTDDRNLIFDKLPLSRFARYRRITVGDTTSMQPSSDPTGHSPPDFVSIILPIKLPHESAETN